MFLGMGLHQSYSQTYKFKTSGFSVMEKDGKGKWGKWSDLDLVNILVKLDTDKSRIIVIPRLFNCSKSLSIFH